MIASLGNGSAMAQTSAPASQPAAATCPFLPEMTFTF